VDGFDNVGAGVVQNFVTALKLLEILHGGTSVLQHRAHGTIGDDDAL